MATWQSIMGAIKDRDEFLEEAIDSQDFITMLPEVVNFRNILVEIKRNPRKFVDNGNKKLREVVILCEEKKEYWLNREIDVTGSFHWYT